MTTRPQTILQNFGDTTLADRCMSSFDEEPETRRSGSHPKPSFDSQPIVATETGRL